MCSPFALRASAEMEVFREAEQDEKAIGRIVDAQREELEHEIGGLKKEAEQIAEEAKELAGEAPFLESEIPTKKILFSPGIDRFHVRWKISGVARDHGELMHQRGRGNETVKHVHVEPFGLVLGVELAPGLQGARIQP